MRTWRLFRLFNLARSTRVVGNLCPPRGWNPSTLSKVAVQNLCRSLPYKNSYNRLGQVIDNGSVAVLCAGEWVRKRAPAVREVPAKGTCFSRKFCESLSICYKFMNIQEFAYS